MKHREKYYNQREIADILGISKATASRYLNKLGVSAKEENGAKLYSEMVLKQLKKQIKANQNHKNPKSTPSTIQLLQEQVDQLKKEVELLKEQLKIKDKQRSEEHTSELQSRFDLVCRLLLEKKK